MAATGERERFRDATGLETVRKLRQYHPRQWVDRSGAAYKRERLDRPLEYHPRQWVDCSGAAYIRERVLRTAAFLAGAFIAVTSTSGCSSSGRDVAASAKAAPAQGAAVENLTRRPISDIPQIKKAVDSAIEQTQQTLQYDPSYAKLDYPNGDVPLERGVCADVIVRAFRNAGVDLQKEVHEDMARHFSAYPAKWGARKPDSNIDHRRVPNLMTLLERKSKSVPITMKPSDYIPGDVVAWELDSHLLHIGLVTDAVAGGTQNYLVVHNIGAGAKLEDVLMTWKIIGHYRMWK